MIVIWRYKVIVTIAQIHICWINIDTLIQRDDYDRAPEYQHFLSVKKNSYICYYQVKGYDPESKYKSVSWMILCQGVDMNAFQIVMRSLCLYKGM